MAGIGTLVFKLLSGGLLDSAVDAYSKYLNKEISEAEFKSRVDIATSQNAADIEKAALSAGVQIYTEAQKTIRASFGAKGWFAQNAWAFVVVSQTFVLLYYQVGIPVLTDFTGHAHARTGDDLLMWAYLLVGGALGIGAAQEYKR